MPSIRQTYAAITIASVVLILIGMYLEHFKGMEPCSLCITQRIFIILCGLVALTAFIHHPTGVMRRVYAGIGVLVALGGSFFAGRQLWLQSLPEDQVPACGPGLSYMFEQFPLGEAFALLLRGDGNCAKIDTILGLSLPWWTLMAFAGFGLMFIYQAVRAQMHNCERWK